MQKGGAGKEGSRLPGNVAGPLVEGVNASGRNDNTDDLHRLIDVDDQTAPFCMRWKPE
jgi:hypothetical protein